jgi:hypothetical protein
MPPVDDGLWKKDALDILADLPSEPPKKGKKAQTEADFIHEQMDEACAGLPAVGKVWLRILQLKRMRPMERHLVLGNAWFQRQGVCRQAKTRALHTLEKAGLIHVTWSDRRSPRVALLARSRRKLTQKRVSTDRDPSAADTDPCQR